MANKITTVILNLDTTKAEQLIKNIASTIKALEQRMLKLESRAKKLAKLK